MAEGNYSLADIAAAMGGNGGFGGMGGSWLAVLFLIILFGGNGGWGNNFSNAIGYENLATSNEVQRGFDNQNSMANQRDILSAVNSGTAQSVAATNQTFHDMLAVLNDKYGELARDVYGVSSLVQQSMANENQCCCNTLRAIDNIKYENSQNTNKILEALAQNKIEALQGKVSELQLAQATSNVVRYPNAWTWNAGPSPFCGGCGC